MLLNLLKPLYDCLSTLICIFADYLLRDILKALRREQRETDQEDIGTRITERSQSIILIRSFVVFSIFL